MSKQVSSSNPEDFDGVPREGTVDHLIRWLERRRRVAPESPLRELIETANLSSDILVELSAIDLIGRRRKGADLRVEDYLQQFPQLKERDQHLLDLIDAEICVRRELDDDRPEAFYIDRFPTFANPIRQLIRLELGAGDYSLDTPNAPSGSLTENSVTSDSIPITAEAAQNRTIPLPPDASESDGEFELVREMTVVDARRRSSESAGPDHKEDSVEVVLPISPPDWMSATRTISTSVNSTGRYWLAKGRDRQRGEIVAMKLIPLPETVNRLQRTRMLDLCESASNVTHPAWIAPRMAAVRDQHLAVVRPWIFGLPLSYSQPGMPRDERLSAWIKIAYSLSAAHRVGATHGNVRPENVIIDHLGQANLVDACSSAAGWEDHLARWNDDLDATLDQRIRRDCGALIGGITAEVFASAEPNDVRLAGLFADEIRPDDADCCAKIGERIQSFLDQPPSKRRWFRR